MNNDKARENLVSGSIVKTMLSLSIPAIIGMVVIGLYNFMDAVFVGRMVGPEAMTAVKVSYPFTLLNSGIATLIGTGSASILSRAIGKKDQETVDKIMGNLIALVLIFSIAVMAIGLIFTNPLLSLSGAKGDILTEANRYLKIVFLGSLFVNFAQASNMVMRGEGKMKTAMLIMGSGAILNIILDPVLILAFGKENGILGAAVATITAQIFQAVLALFYFLKKSETVMIAATLLASVFYIPVMIAPEAMLSMFITDPAIVAMGAPMLRVLFSTYITYGVLILAITFFQAVGKGGSAAALTVLRQILLFLPLVLTLPLVFTNSVEGVFYAQMITDAVVLVLGIIMMAAAFRNLRKEDRVAFA